MALRDPGPEDPWQPQQFWECPVCNRHFWTTFPAAKPAKPAPKAPPPVAKPAPKAPAPAE